MILMNQRYYNQGRKSKKSILPPRIAPLASDTWANTTSTLKCKPCERNKSYSLVT